MIHNIIMVGLGGFVGCTLRYLLSLAIKFDSFPLSLVLINALGSFMIGIFSILFRENFISSPHVYLLLTTGLLGGFTSFSTFSLETILLFERGKIMLGIIHILLTVIVCVVSTMLARLITMSIINMINTAK